MMALDQLHVMYIDVLVCSAVPTYAVARKECVKCHYRHPDCLLGLGALLRIFRE